METNDDPYALVDLESTIDPYALVDLGSPSGHPFRFAVTRIRELERWFQDYGDLVLATGTQEEMEALLKLMDAAHEN